MNREKIEDWIFNVVGRILHIWFAWFIFLLLFWNINPLLAWIVLIGYSYKRFSKIQK